MVKHEDLEGFRSSGLILSLSLPFGDFLSLVRGVGGSGRSEEPWRR